MENTFHFFDSSHLSVLALTGFLSILLSVIGRKAGENSKTDLFLRRSLSLILVVNELTFWMSDIVSGQWNIQTGVPIQICDVLVFMCAYTLLYPDRIPFLSELTYFWALTGAVQALLTPSFAAPFPSYIFFKFFITHGAIVIGAIYLVSVLGVRPNFRSALKALFATNIWALFVGMFNLVFSTNYMFLSAKPSRPSVLDYMGPWPWYIVAMEVFTLIFFMALALPFCRNKTTVPGTKGTRS